MEKGEYDVETTPELSVLYQGAERELLNKYVDEFALLFDDNAFTYGDNWEEKTDFIWKCFKEDVAEIFEYDFQAEEIAALMNRFPSGTTLPEIIDKAFPKQPFLDWLARHQPNPFEAATDAS